MPWRTLLTPSLLPLPPALSPPVVASGFPEQIMPVPVYLSLLPIIGGVALASVTVGPVFLLGCPGADAP